jgi:hypothetical protein
MTGVASAYRAIIACALCAGALGFSSSALAQPSLRDGLFGRHSSEGRPPAAPPVARYVSEDGDSFTLDRSTGRPMLKFDGNPEVWVLLPQPAPRGDVIYKNDLGEPVLRATRLGGVTLFTDDRPTGSAAALAGGGAPLRLPPIGPQALLERLGQASLRSSRVARHAVVFQAEATPESSALIGDAAVVVTLALGRVADKPEGRSRLASLRQVFIEEGRKVAAQIREGALRITVVPALGMAGRPSSEKVAKVVYAGR